VTERYQGIMKFSLSEKELEEIRKKRHFLGIYDPRSKR
jgi:hypothetical protein